MEFMIPHPVAGDAGIQQRRESACSNSFNAHPSFPRRGSFDSNPGYKLQASVDVLFGVVPGEDVIFKLTRPNLQYSGIPATQDGHMAVSQYVPVDEGVSRRPDYKKTSRQYPGYLFFSAESWLVRARVHVLVRVRNEVINSDEGVCTHLMVHLIKEPTLSRIDSLYSIHITIPRHLHSKVHIVTPGRPCRPRGRSAVSVFCRDAFDVLKGKLTLEFGLERGECADHFGASLLEGSNWWDRSICLNFYQKVWVEWVGDLVASEKDLWHGKKLAREKRAVRAAKAELNKRTRGPCSQACDLASRPLWSQR